jgi:hypothetical protein
MTGLLRHVTGTDDDTAKLMIGLVTIQARMKSYMADMLPCAEASGRTFVKKRYVGLVEQVLSDVAETGKRYEFVFWRCSSTGKHGGNPLIHADDRCHLCTHTETSSDTERINVWMCSNNGSTTYTVSYDPFATM